MPRGNKCSMLLGRTPSSAARPLGEKGSQREVALGQKENPWGPQVDGSIFPFTNRFFLGTFLLTHSQVEGKVLMFGHFGPY